MENRHSCLLILQFGRYILRKILILKVYKYSLLISIALILCIYLYRQGSCNLSWPWTYPVAEITEILTYLPLPAQCADYRHLSLRVYGARNWPQGFLQARQEYDQLSRIPAHWLLHGQEVGVSWGGHIFLLKGNALLYQDILLISYSQIQHQRKLL